MLPTIAKSRSESGRPPLDRAALDRLALHYVGRYQTSRARLAAYLRRALDRRGWAGDDAPPVDAVVERMAALGYVDDGAFAEARAKGLQRRGYGARRQAAALGAAGIEPEQIGATIDALDADPFETALAFARRRRIGPYARLPLDPDQRHKAIAALIRAGHDFRIARQVVDWTPDV